jgi:hypothetical protein
MVAKLFQAKATTKIIVLNLGAVSAATFYVVKLPLCVVLSLFYKVWVTGTCLLYILFIKPYSFIHSGVCLTTGS